MRKIGDHLIKPDPKYRPQNRNPKNRNPMNPGYGPRPKDSFDDDTYREVVIGDLQCTAVQICGLEESVEKIRYEHSGRDEGMKIDEALNRELGTLLVCAARLARKIGMTDEGIELATQNEGIYSNGKKEKP